MAEGNATIVPLIIRPARRVRRQQDPPLATYDLFIETYWHRPDLLPLPKPHHSLLALEEPLSVIPACHTYLRETIGFAPEPAWHGPIPTWHSVPCRLCQAIIGLPNHAVHSLRRFSILLLLPDEDPLDVRPFIYLGMQFFSQFRATITVDCSAANTPPRGTLLFPLHL